MKTKIYLFALFALGILSTVSSCDDNEDINSVAPSNEDAAFTYEFDTANPNKVNFKAVKEIDAWYTNWNFGDNSSAEGFEASKIFLKKGDYDVRFKVFTTGGTAESTQTVVINSDFEGPNILKNGEFNGSDQWTILPITDGVEVSFNNDEAHWTGGGWGQVGIYQPVQVLANNMYQISMDIKGGPLLDAWFEVYIGMEAPVAGQDYVDGGMRLALNTWDGCGGEPFEGDFSEISCKGTGPTFEFTEAGTAYFVIRGGGGDFGSGVIVDNIAIRSLESSEVVAPPLTASFTVEISDLTATFTNTSNNASDFFWDFGDGSGTSTEENPTYTYSEGGNYTVKLTTSDDSGSTETTKEISIVNTAATPSANFSYQVSDLFVAFTNTSTNATSYSWDFGDGATASSEENPNYTYNTAGSYTVTLTASNDNGSNEYTSNVVVTAPSTSNLISNGSFETDNNWTIINHYEATNTNGSVTIADGVAKFEETTNTDWKHMGIYTSVNLEVGTYQFDMDMTYNDISDVWGEVYIGTGEPMQGSDYNGDQQILKAYNAWDCSAIKTYDGKATEGGCDEAENPGQFQITTPGTYYLLFRSGGASYGTTGIVLDNISLVKIQ